MFLRSRLAAARKTFSLSLSLSVLHLVLEVGIPHVVLRLRAFSRASVSHIWGSGSRQFDCFLQPCVQGNLRTGEIKILQPSQEECGLAEMLAHNLNIDILSQDLYAALV